METKQQQRELGWAVLSALFYALAIYTVVMQLSAVNTDWLLIVWVIVAALMYHAKVQSFRLLQSMQALNKKLLQLSLDLTAEKKSEPHDKVRKARGQR